MFGGISRSPHGERGLKSRRPASAQSVGASLSSRRAWIEIDRPADSGDSHAGRSPHGERGLKFGEIGHVIRLADSRSPHGERGLKLHGHRRSFFQRVALLTESVD